MPRIPDFAAPSVGLQSQQSGGALQSPRVVPYQDQSIRQGQELSQTVQGIGTEMMRHGQQLSAEYDDARVKQGDNRFADVIRKELEDPNAGYLNQVGEKAIGKSREDAFKRIEQQAQSLMQGMDNDAQRQSFAMQVERQMRQALGRADDHEARQTKAFAIGQTKGRVDSLSMEALRSVGTAQFGTVKGAMVKETQALLSLAGIPIDSEQGKNAILGVTTDLHDQAIRGMVEQDPQGARAYLAEHRAEIAPDKANALTGLVRTASIHQEGDALFQSIKGKGDLLEQMNMVDSNQSISPEARAIAKQQLQQYEAIAYQTEQRGARKAIEDLQNWTRLNREDPNMVGPVAVPPAQMIEDARKYGVLDDYTVWVKNGGQNETTARGSNLLLGLSDAALRGLSTREDVVKAFRSDLDDAGMTKMLARWESLRPNASPEAMTEHYVSLTINSEARKAGILPETYREKDLTPAEAAAFQKWELALRDIVRSATAGRKPEPQDWRDAAKVLREDAMANGVPVAVATRDQIAKGIWQVDGAVPGEKVQIGANVVQSMRADALLAIKSDPRMKDVPDWAISERQIATQVAYMVGKQNEANTAQMAKDAAASDEGYAAAQVAKRQGHSIVYNLFQNTLAMTPGGDAKKARADGLAKVDDALLRSYGLTRADAEGIADQFFRAQETIASDNSVSAGWKRYRANLISKDPAYSDQSSFWKRQREAFDRWMFEGQERARQENAARFPGDQQFTFEAVWGKPSASFMDSPSAEQMLEFQRGGGK